MPLFTENQGKDFRTLVLSLLDDMSHEFQGAPLCSARSLADARDDSASPSSLELPA